MYLSKIDILWSFNLFFQSPLILTMSYSFFCLYVGLDYLGLYLLLLAFIVMLYAHRIHNNILSITWWSSWLNIFVPNCIMFNFLPLLSTFIKALIKYQYACVVSSDNCKDTGINIAKVDVTSKLEVQNRFKYQIFLISSVFYIVIISIHLSKYSCHPSILRPHW